MLWLYAQSWFLNFSVFGVNMHELFQVRPFNLSVAVWVGFLALFGIASDNGVVLATYLTQSFSKTKITSLKDIREATLFASIRRIRPCLMTSATTILALIPVLTSVGRGADVMVPMDKVQVASPTDEALGVLSRMMETRRDLALVIAGGTVIGFIERNSLLRFGGAAG